MNLGRLRGKIAESGIKKKALAECMGITPQALHKKLIGETKISTDEAKVLCEVLSFSSYQEKCEIFLQ